MLLLCLSFSPPLSLSFSLLILSWCLRSQNCSAGHPCTALYESVCEWMSAVSFIRLVHTDCSANQDHPLCQHLGQPRSDTNTLSHTHMRTHTVEMCYSLVSTCGNKGEETTNGYFFHSSFLCCFSSLAICAPFFLSPSHLSLASPSRPRLHSRSWAAASWVDSFSRLARG